MARTNIQGIHRRHAIHLFGRNVNKHEQIHSFFQCGRHGMAGHHPSSRRHARSTRRLSNSKKSNRQLTETTNRSMQHYNHGRNDGTHSGGGTPSPSIRCLTKITCSGQVRGSMGASSLEGASGGTRRKEGVEKNCTTYCEDRVAATDEKRATTTTIPLSIWQWQWVERGELFSRSISPNKSLLSDEKLKK